MKARLALVAVSLVLSLLIGTIMSKSGQPNATTTRARPVIGLSLDTLKEARWQRDKDYFVAAATQLGADELAQSANSDDTRQMQDVQALLSSGVDVLVIVPHNGEAMAKAVALAHQAKVPVIAY